jgi:transcriptional regulator with XRE-family HTH domain
MNDFEFGNYLSKVRREAGMSQSELAGFLNVTNKAVSKWETGQSIPDVALLIPLAELLGVTVTELLECRRMEKILRAADVEKIVKKAVSYKDTEKSTVNIAVIVILALNFIEFVGVFIKRSLYLKSCRAIRHNKTP